MDYEIHHNSCPRCGVTTIPEEVDTNTFDEVVENQLFPNLESEHEHQEHAGTDYTGDE